MVHYLTFSNGTLKLHRVGVGRCLKAVTSVDNDDDVMYPYPGDRSILNGKEGSERNSRNQDDSGTRYTPSHHTTHAC